MLPVLLTVVALLLFSFLCYIYWSCSYWQRHGIRGTHGWPLVGNMLQFCIGRRHYGEVYQDIYNRFPQLSYIGIYRVFNEPAILLRDLSLVKEVMIRSFQHFQDNVLWVNPQRDPAMCVNPFIAKGQMWKSMRAEILPIFTPNKVKSSFPHIHNVCRKLETYVAQHIDESFEAKNLFSKYTLDVVASAAYGLNAESFTNSRSDFTQLVEHVFQPNSMSLLNTTALLFSPTLGNLIQYHYVPPGVQKWLHTIVGTILQKRIAALDRETVTQNNDFMQWLIEAKHKSKEPVDPATIVGHCGTFLLEGFETSSSLMAFTMFEYARNPEIQNRVLQEIDQVLRRHNNVPSHTALQEMPYFEATLYEALRMYPAMLALLKHCTKSFELPPQTPGSPRHYVNKGTVFVVPVQAIHYDPDLYPAPDVYKPERFLADSERQKLSCAFLGFGEGPRMCPGMRFGLAQVKAGLVTLLSKYSVELSAQTNPTMKLAPSTFLTATKNGIWIKFKARTVAQ